MSDEQNDDPIVDPNESSDDAPAASDGSEGTDLPPFPGFTRVKGDGKGWKVKKFTEGVTATAQEEGTDGDLNADAPEDEPPADEPVEEGENSEVVEAANITIEEEEDVVSSGEEDADGDVDDEGRLEVEIEDADPDDVGMSFEMSDDMFEIDGDDDDGDAAWVLTTEDGEESWGVVEADEDERGDSSDEDGVSSNESRVSSDEPEDGEESEADELDAESDEPESNEPESDEPEPETDDEEEPETSHEKPESGEADEQESDGQIDVSTVEDLLQETAEIAKKSGLHSLHREVINDRIPALHAGRITLVVLGEFNHGKSTVVNALLGEEVLPMGITPTTAVITHLVHGDKRKVVVQPPLDGEKYEIHPDEMADVVKHADEGAQEPEYVEIQHPNAFLQGGLTLVDTPGVNDISKQKVEITYGYLPRADVILYVLDATQVLKKSEVVFIRDRLLKSNRDRIIFVLGKVDALDPADAEEVELYARERLEGIIGPVELYAFSGREALRAVKAGKEPPAAFTAFRDSITEFLRKQRNYIILDSALGGGLRVASLLEQNLAVKKSGLSMEAGELDARVTAVRSRLNESRQVISDNLDLIDERVGGIAATARHNLRSFTQKFREALPVEIERAEARDVKRHLPGFIQDTFKAWLEEEGKSVAGNLEDLAEEIIEITNASIAETLGVLREELGVSGDLDLEVDTMAYDVSVFALGALGIAAMFANAIVGGLLTLAAPVLAFFLRDRVDAKIKERAREEGDKAIERASEIIEEELVRMIQEYGDKLKEFVETAGDRLFRQIEEALAEVQRERAESSDIDALLAETQADLEGTRRVGNMMRKARERLAEA